jgi:hypothetical protein
MGSQIKQIVLFLAMLFNMVLFAKDYYVHPTLGNDTNSGESKNLAFQTLKRASKINFKFGDRLLLASGETYPNAHNLVNVHGVLKNPIIITSISWQSSDTKKPAIIDFKGEPNGILIENSSFITISNIQLTANGYYTDSEKESKMRCAILVNNKQSSKMHHIKISNFKRGVNEVKTANGTQKYGWGIRVINANFNGIIEHITIENCHIKNIAHTGIKLTGNKKNIANITISGNKLEATGGPGIQMSEVKNVNVRNISVNVCIRDRFSS